jgi:UDP-3-O-[3-hydroxymyristoyl] glucosamine N-acyltransferase
MPGGKTLDELSVLLDGRVAGDGSVLIKGVASMDEAKAGDITFVGHRRYLRLLASTGASAVILSEEVILSGGPAGGGPAGGVAGKNLLLVANPMAAFAKALEIFRPEVLPPPGIHPLAFIARGAYVADGASVQAFAVVEEGARIGAGSVIFPGVYIGRGASVGERSILYPGVAIRDGCAVGNRVVIHCNSVIGSDGFGYFRDGARHVKIPQRGTVVIEDDVEIGAAATVDRATVGSTVIGRGTKIDNLVQIAHNVKVGADSVIVAQVGVAGSTTIGAGVVIGGQSGVAGHVNVGSGASIGARSGVTGDVPEGSVCSGMPAMPHAQWLRAQSLFARLPEMKKRLDELERRLEGLEAAERGRV